MLWAYSTPLIIKGLNWVLMFFPKSKWGQIPHCPHMFHRACRQARMGGCRVAHFVVRRHAQHAGGGDAGDAVSSPDVGCGV